jgi:hypothetical protein
MKNGPVYRYNTDFALNSKTGLVAWRYSDDVIKALS